MVLVTKLSKDIKVHYILKTIWNKFKKQREYRRHVANIHIVSLKIAYMFEKALLRRTGGEGITRKIRGYIKNSFSFYTYVFH